MVLLFFQVLWQSLVCLNVFGRPHCAIFLEGPISSSFFAVASVYSQTSRNLSSVLCLVNCVCQLSTTSTALSAPATEVLQKCWLPLLLPLQWCCRFFAWLKDCNGTVKPEHDLQLFHFLREAFYHCFPVIAQIPLSSKIPYRDNFTFSKMEMKHVTAFTLTTHRAGHQGRRFDTFPLAMAPSVDLWWRLSRTKEG